MFNYNRIATDLRIGLLFTYYTEIKAQKNIFLKNQNYKKNKMSFFLVSLLCTNIRNNTPLNFITRVMTNGTCQQIWTSGPTPRWCLNTAEHSGNSPRSANNDSSSSPIGKNIAAATSASAVLLSSSKIGVSSMVVEEVVSISPNQLLNSLSAVVQVISES